MRTIFNFLANVSYRFRNIIRDNTPKHIINSNTWRPKAVWIIEAVTAIADFWDGLAQDGVRQLILSSIWDILRKLDKGEKWDYETAPYCGHHYNGFENKYIVSSFHEGDGGGKTKFNILGYKLGFDNVVENKFYIWKPKNKR